MATTQWSNARIGVGDEVIVPAFGGLQAAEKVRARGAVPVPVDIDARSFCIDPESVAAAVTDRTVAVVARDQFGRPVDMAPLAELTVPRGIQLLHEACSHHAADPALTDMAARRRNAAYLNAHLTGVLVPDPGPQGAHTYETYVVRVPGNGRPDRDAFAHALRGRGVRCHVPVRTAVHRTPGFGADIRLPAAERAVDQCLALPVDPALSRRELHRLAAACNALGGLLLEPAA